MPKVQEYNGQYIIDRIKIDPTTECWLWQGHIRDDGYGQPGTKYFYKKYGKQLVHQISYLEFVGPILDNLLVRHSCRNRHCCNPKHLSLGTNQDNADDRKRDGMNANLGKGKRIKAKGYKRGPYKPRSTNG